MSLIVAESFTKPKSALRGCGISLGHAGWKSAGGPGGDQSRVGEAAEKIVIVLEGRLERDSVCN
jgi:hypothetical protein